jgi:hypothetical protein
MYNSCSIQNERPTIIVTTQDLFEEYEANIESTKLQTTDTSMAEAGFMNQTFKGTPMVFDEDCQTSSMLFLNANTPFQSPENQDAKVSNVLFAGNLVVNKRDVHGRIGNFVARS